MTDNNNLGNQRISQSRVVIELCLEVYGHFVYIRKNGARVMEVTEIIS